jgi:hypothetical protein
VPANLEWEVRERRVERLIPVGQHLRPLAFRSGGGVTTLLQDSPLAMHQFMFDTPKYPAGGLAALNRKQIGDTPGLGVPSDVIGVTREGVSLYLDRETGRVTSQTVSIRRSIVVRLDDRDTVQSGCALGERAVAFIEEARPGTVLFRSIGEPSTAWTLPFPPGYTDGLEAKWSELRFGGAADGPCVLWAPRMRTVMIVSDSAVQPLGPFIEPVEPEAWYHHVWRWMTRAPAPVYTLDATGFPGGVAVLFAGRTDGSGRMVDLYAANGAYLETMVLPRPALRVAGNWARLFVLSEHRDTVLLASYMLPSAVSSGFPPEPSVPVDTRLYPAWLRALYPNASGGYRGAPRPKAPGRTAPPPK